MKIADYLRETKGEMKHVSWPTRRQAIAFTILVIVVSVITALLLGLFDTGFSFIPKALLNQ